MQVEKTTHGTGENEIDYKKVAESPEFQELLNTKKKFIIPITIFFFCFYMALPLLAAYTKVLTKPAIGSITWAWVLAFAEFVMTWVLCMMYSRKATQFDEQSGKILTKMNVKGK